MTQESRCFKFILIGSSGVGKTSILKRLVDGRFSNELQSTIGVEYSSFHFEINGEQVKLQLWDTAGQERFRSVAKSYFRNAVGVVLVFDITERKTFDDVNGWLADVHQLCDPAASVLLVGNKLDMESERTVTLAEAEQYAQHHQLNYIETSAFNGTNIREAFFKLAETLYRKNAKSSSAIEMTALPPQDSSGCNC